MNFIEFQAFVGQYAEWFEGARKESVESLTRAEKLLGCRFPPSMNWLLTHFGYSDEGTSGIDEGVSGVVEITLRCRENMQLPHRYIILNDWNDA